MKKTKIIRGALYTNNVNLATFNAFRSIDETTFRIHYSYIDGSLAYIVASGFTGATTEPVVEGSVTTAITVTPANFAGYTGATQQLAVVNEDGLNVISECNFFSYNTGIATVSTGATPGIITVVSRSGSTTIRTSHADAVSGYTGVSGYTWLTTSVSTTITGATLSGSTGATYTLILQNQGNLVIPNAEFTYVSATPAKASVSAAGLIRWVALGGSSVITATHIYTGLTATFTVITV